MKMTNYEKQETKLLWELFPTKMLERFKIIYGFKNPYWDINNLDQPTEHKRQEELIKIENCLRMLKNSSVTYREWVNSNGFELNSY